MTATIKSKWDEEEGKTSVSVSSNFSELHEMDRLDFLQDTFIDIIERYNTELDNFIGNKDKHSKVIDIEQFLPSRN